MQIGHRSDMGSDFRYAFNGKEQDPEWSGNGNVYDYGFRIYNPRLGKFLSVDPLTDSYPFYTPYQYAGNKPIRFIDLDGLEEHDPIPEGYYADKTKLNMDNAPESSPRTALGHKRNGPWFWKEQVKKHPEMFSEKNKAKIKKRQAPIIDETWIKHNNNHQGFKGDKLVHHHIDQGNIAVGLPEKVHKSWNKILHPFRGARGQKVKGVVNSGLVLFDVVGTIAGFVSDDPHGMGATWDQIQGKLKGSRIYFDENSGAYFKISSQDDIYNKEGDLISTEIQFEVYRMYYKNEESGNYEGFDQVGEGYIIKNSEGEITDSKVIDYREKVN